MQSETISELNIIPPAVWGVIAIAAIVLLGFLFNKRNKKKSTLHLFGAAAAAVVAFVAVAAAMQYNNVKNNDLQLLAMSWALGMVFYIV